MNREEADREYEEAQREAHRPLKPNQVAVETRAYEASHGRKPRGRGMWAFTPRRNWMDFDEIQWFEGFYSEARRKAQAFFAERGVPEIWAQP